MPFPELLGEALSSHHSLRQEVLGPLAAGLVSLCGGLRHHFRSCPWGEVSA